LHSGTAEPITTFFNIDDKVDIGSVDERVTKAQIARLLTLENAKK